MKEISFHQLLTMSPKKLANEGKKKEREDALKRGLLMNRNDWQVEEQSKNVKQGMFKCEKCKGLRTGYI